MPIHTITPTQQNSRGSTTDKKLVPHVTLAWGVVFSYIAAAVFAFFFCWICGQRGFFSSDQSIVFDGGYRILSGQVPFKDFVSPIGPIPFLAQAAFFWIFGVSFSSYLMHSCTANAVAALCAISLIRTLFPGRTYLGISSGVLTAVWFYPSFGTPYPEHTAFFLGFPALALIVYVLVSANNGPLRGNLIILASGILSALAILSKQNAGVLIAMASLGLILASCCRREASRRDWLLVGMFMIGLFVTLATFVIWVYRYSDPSLFYHYFLEVPFELGLSRVQSLSVGLKRMLIPYEHPMLRIALYGSAAIWICVAAAFLGPYNLQKTRRSTIAFTLLLLLLTAQSLMIPTMNNAVIYTVPFTGIIVALSFGLAQEFVLPLVRIKPVVMSVVFVCIGLGLAFVGCELSWNRRDMLFSTSIFRPLPIHGLKTLKWGEPTTIRTWQVSGNDVADLVSHLTAQGKPFFVFPDFTMLYGIVGKPNPQPICWFHPGVTYSAKGEPSLDRWIASDLKRNEVEVIVLEKCAWLGLDMLDRFPLTKNLIQDDFTLVRTIGPWEVLHRRSQDQVELRRRSLDQSTGMR